MKTFIKQADRNEFIFNLKIGQTISHEGIGYTIVRMTDTQATAVGTNGKIRIMKGSGKVIGIGEWSVSVAMTECPSGHEIVASDSSHCYRCHSIADAAKAAEVLALFEGHEGKQIRFQEISIGGGRISTYPSREMKFVGIRESDRTEGVLYLSFLFDDPERVFYLSFLFDDPNGYETECTVNPLRLEWFEVIEEEETEETKKAVASCPECGEAQEEVKEDEYAIDAFDAPETFLRCKNKFCDSNYRFISRSGGPPARWATLFSATEGERVFLTRESAEQYRQAAWREALVEGNGCNVEWEAVTPIRWTKDEWCWYWSGKIRFKNGEHEGHVASAYFNFWPDGGYRKDVACEYGGLANLSTSLTYDGGVGELIPSHSIGVVREGWPRVEKEGEEFGIYFPGLLEESESSLDRPKIEWLTPEPKGTGRPLEGKIRFLQGKHKGHTAQVSAVVYSTGGGVRPRGRVISSCSCGAGGTTDWGTFSYPIHIGDATIVPTPHVGNWPYSGSSDGLPDGEVFHWREAHPIGCARCGGGSKSLYVYLFGFCSDCRATQLDAEEQDFEI